MEMELQHAVKRLDTVHRHWRQLTDAIDSHVRSVANRRGIAVRTERGIRGDDDAPLFMMDSGENVLVLTLYLADRRIRSEFHFANGNVVTCGYTLDREGVWTGPLAPGAQNRRMEDSVAARDISDGWLLAYCRGSELHRAERRRS